MTTTLKLILLHTISLCYGITYVLQTQPGQLQ